MTKKPLGHGAAANISGANEKDGLHSRVNSVKVRCVAEIVNGKSKTMALLDDRQPFE